MGNIGLKFRVGDIIRAINKSTGTYFHFIIYKIDKWHYVAYCIEDGMPSVSISPMYDNDFEKVA